MFKKEILSNGLNCLLSPRAETEAVTVLVLVKVGSRHENSQINGISHFIEHLMFKGSKLWPTSLQITQALDGVGADYNAFTGKDHTGYYIKVSKEHLPLALSLLSDMVFNPLFPPAEIERERGVIIEEINMYEDNPLMLIGNVFEETIFQHHPLGQPISGPKENILNITRAQLLEYYQANYLQGFISLGLAGNFNPKIGLNLLERYFGKPRLKNYKIKQSIIDLKQTQPQLKFKAKDTMQLQMALGFPTYNNLDPKNYALELLAVILGGNMSSRLFVEVREKRGLAYFVKAGVNEYEDTGNLMIQCGLDQKNLTQALKTIIKELASVKKSDIKQDELKRAKEFLKGKLVLQLEDSASLISWLGEQYLLTGKIEDLQEKIKKIMAVTLPQIKKVAAEIINFNKINLCLIGPANLKNQKNNLIKIIKN